MRQWGHGGMEYFTCIKILCLQELGIWVLKRRVFLLYDAQEENTRKCLGSSSQGIIVLNLHKTSSVGILYCEGWNQAASPLQENRCQLMADRGMDRNFHKRYKHW